MDVAEEPWDVAHMIERAHVERRLDEGHARAGNLDAALRARLAFDGQAGRGSAFASAMKHDDSRHQIAHGALLKTRIDVSAVVADCHLIPSALHRAA